MRSDCLLYLRGGERPRCDPVTWPLRLCYAEEDCLFLKNVSKNVFLTQIDALVYRQKG